MHRRIVIVGFMGSGKTTVAKTLAERLHCEMIDLDSFITEREGRSPAEIIRADGEPAFREIESLALSDALQNRDVHVIALGGGTWTVPANRTLIALHECLSLWLDAPFDLCWERIARADTLRPLAPDRATAKTRYQSRLDDYALAEQQISVDSADSSKTLVEKILRQT